MRLLQRLGVALRAVELEVLAVVGGVGLGPHRPHDLDGLGQHGDAVLRRQELVAVPPELVLVPPRADPPVEAAAADHVDVRGDLRQQTRVAVRRAPDHLAEPHPGRPLAEGGEGGPALEHRLVGRSGHVVEVVVDPDRVIAEPLGELGDLDRLGPLGFGAVDVDELGLPPLRHEGPERDRTCGHDFLRLDGQTAADATASSALAVKRRCAAPREPASVSRTRPPGLRPAPAVRCRRSATGCRASGRRSATRRRCGADRSDRCPRPPRGCPGRRPGRACR